MKVMKLAARFLCLTEVLLISAITCFIYTLLRGHEVRREMPRSMQLNLSAGECKDTVCLSLLSAEESIQYDMCYNRTVSTKSVSKFGPINKGTCHFHDGITRFTVGLGSFQGSGNTWLRGLLQQVTGICTGT